MKKTELTKALKQVFGAGDYSDFEVKFALNAASKELRLEISQMYEYVELTFQALGKIAELMGTDQINLGDKWGSHGCDTCDHGSCYTVNLYLKNFQDTIED